MSITIAMWSGPRNISTAMMRAWENRPDCTVWDEPLYAAYLHDTGIDHPMREAILQHDENDWRKVIARCAESSPDDNHVFYQKHMTHHMLPHYSRDWLSRVQHCFLLRHPRDVLLSYSQKRDTVELADIGIVEQLELFDAVTELNGEAPLIIDTVDFLHKPEDYLRAICDHFSISFYSEMLSWPKGPRDSDGVWAEHWYANVWQSTGFGPARESNTALNQTLTAILEEALPAYDSLRAHCLIL